MGFFSIHRRSTLDQPRVYAGFNQNWIQSEYSLEPKCGQFTEGATPAASFAHFVAVGGRDSAPRKERSRMVPPLNRPLRPPYEYPRQLRFALPRRRRRGGATCLHGMKRPERHVTSPVVQLD